MTFRVTIWNEFVHEREQDDVRHVYPDGIHVVLEQVLKERLGDMVTTKIATLHYPDHGLTEQVLAGTDVLMWWGHAAHDLVKDKIVDRIQQRVLQGMGLIVLHSGHLSKIFRRLMGTNCTIRWREIGECERLWIVNPYHAITAGIEGEFFELPQTEMYGEYFDIPSPDELIFLSWFEGGEVFRSGCTFFRGRGRIFYFRPGHETYPIYYDKNVGRVLANSVCWAKATGATYRGEGRQIPDPLSPVGKVNQTE